MKAMNIKDTLVNAAFCLKLHRKTSHLVKNMVEPQKIIYIKIRSYYFLTKFCIYSSIVQNKTEDNVK